MVSIGTRAIGVEDSDGPARRWPFGSLRRRPQPVGAGGRGQPVTGGSDAVLQSASLSVVRPNALCPRFCFGHVAAVLGLAVPAIAEAVIDLADGIYPNLTGAAIRA